MRVSNAIFDYLSSTEFYSIISSCLVFVSEHGTTHEKKKFVLSICRLCFIGKSEEEIEKKPKKTKQMQTENEIDILNEEEEPTKMKNMNSFSIFLEVFKKTRSNDTRETIINILEIFLNNFVTYSEIKILEPFHYLFLQFQSLSLDLRLKVMKLVDDALEGNDTTLNKISISMCDDESRTLVSLLNSKRPSNLLIVSTQLIKLLKSYKIQPSSLYFAGMCDILETLFLPIIELPFNESLHDKVEVRDCQRIILQSTTNIKMKEKVNEKEQSEIVKGILVNISYRILTLTRLFFKRDKILMRKLFSDEESIVMQKKRILRKLIDLINCHESRPFVLEIVSLIVSKIDNRKISNFITKNIISKLINFSGSSSTTELDMLEMRKDLLSTISNIYNENPYLKSTFKTGGGFVWCLSVLGSLGKQRSSFQINEHYIFQFLISLINTMGECIKGNEENKIYFETQIDFNTFSDSILESGFFVDNYAIEISNSLLTICVENKWPPSCSVHYGKHTSTSQISPICCSVCERGLFILFPELLKSVLKMIKQSWDKISSKNICCILDSLNLLMKSSPNYRIVQSEGRQFIQTIIEQFGDVIKSVQSENPVQSSLIQLLESVGRNSHISTKEARSLLKLISPGGDFPLNILQMMLKFTETTYSPSHYLYFPRYGNNWLSVNTFFFFFFKNHK